VASSIRQTRIFVPANAPFEDETWIEGLLGHVVAPLVESAPTLTCFWFSRYVLPPGIDDGDCDISQIPEPFFFAGNTSRSLRLRYAIPESDCQAFEDRAQALIAASGCNISDFRPYPWIADLGGPRFLGEDRDDARCATRADLMANFLCALSRLVVNSLRGPDEDGRYRLETADPGQNRHGSSFEAIHHLFCNITDVPTSVEWVDPSGRLIEMRVRF